jgi:hypothetical protein
MDFLTLYERARQKHPELVSLTQQELSLRESEDREPLSGPARRLDLLYAIAIPITFGIAIVSINATVRLAAKLARVLAAYDYRYVFQSLPGLSYALVVTAILIFYYFLIPLFVPSVPYSVVSYPYTRSRSFKITACVAIWIGVALVILPVAGSTSAGPRPGLVLALHLWLFPLAIILGLALPVVALAQVIALVSALSSSWSGMGQTSRGEVLHELLTLLSDWGEEGVSSTTLGPTIRMIAVLIHNLNFVPSAKKTRDQRWASHQYQLAAENLLVCSSWLYVPKQGTVELVRQRLVVFTNAFLTGNLDDLPRAEITAADGLMPPSPRRSLLTSILLSVAVFVYGLAPFVLFAVFRNRLGSLGVPLSIWLMLYSLWLIAGFIAYLRQTSQNPTETLYGLLKLLIGK